MKSVETLIDYTMDRKMPYNDNRFDNQPNCYRTKMILYHLIDTIKWKKKLIGAFIEILISISIFLQSK